MPDIEILVIGASGLTGAALMQAAGPRAVGCGSRDADVRDPATTQVEDQTRAALENIRRVLERERLTMANVVSTTVYLRSINDLGAMEQAYDAAFRTRFPARTVVEATNLPRGARVQIAVVAGR